MTTELQPLRALVPWPMQTATRLDALNSLRRALDKARSGDAVDDLDERIERSAVAVAAEITHYAPDAPQAVKNEALIRAVAWLQDTRGAEREISQSFGTIDVKSEPAPVQSGTWFTHSGARSLLAPYRTRHAGTIKTGD